VGSASASRDHSPARRDLIGTGIASSGRTGIRRARGGDDEGTGSGMGRTVYTPDFAPQVGIRHRGSGDQLVEPSRCGSTLLHIPAVMGITVLNINLDGLPDSKTGS
jgi:hypothetical protein